MPCFRPKPIDTNNQEYFPVFTEDPGPVFIRRPGHCQTHPSSYLKTSAYLSWGWKPWSAETDLLYLKTWMCFPYFHLKTQAIWPCFHPTAQRHPPLFLPEDFGTFVLGLETLVSQNRPTISGDLGVLFMFSHEGTGDLAHCFHSRALPLFYLKTPAYWSWGWKTLVSWNSPVKPEDLGLPFLFSSEGPDTPAPLFT